MSDALTVEECIDSWDDALPTPSEPTLQAEAKANQAVKWLAEDGMEYGEARAVVNRNMDVIDTLKPTDAEMSDGRKIEKVEWRFLR